VESVAGLHSHIWRCWWNVAEIRDTLQAYETERMNLDDGISIVREFDFRLPLVNDKCHLNMISIRLDELE